MTALLDRKLLFVTGKGGVGKSTVAASLGMLAAEQGKKTLVCEVDAKGNLADFYEAGATGFAARELQPGLWAMSMNTEESLKEYLSLQLKIPFLAKIGPLARTFDFIANAAPGVKEILTIGKLCWEVRERHYDLVVVDSVATGHIVGQLTAPQAINELVQVGMVRNQTQWMLDILTDPARTGVVVVATPEEMPVNETIELIGRLDTETDISVAAVIANRVLPELFGRGGVNRGGSGCERQGYEEHSCKTNHGVSFDAVSVAMLPGRFPGHSAPAFFARRTGALPPRPGADRRRFRRSSDAASVPAAPIRGAEK